MYSLGIIKLKTIFISFLFLSSLLHGVDVNEETNSLPEMAKSLLGETKGLYIPVSPIPLNDISDISYGPADLSMEDQSAPTIGTIYLIASEDVLVRIIQGIDGKVVFRGWVKKRERMKLRHKGRIQILVSEVTSLAIEKKGKFFNLGYEQSGGGIAYID